MKNFKCRFNGYEFQQHRITVHKFAELTDYNL